MVEISDFEFRIIEVALVAIVGIALPILYSTWRNTIRQAKEMTKMRDDIDHLRSESDAGQTEHVEIRKEVKDVNTRLARIEGKLSKE